MAGTKKTPSGPKGGRPRIEIDFELLEELCRIQCTAEEIANVMGISVDTLDRRLREQFGEGFADYRKRFADQGKMSLRRQQWRAVEQGNVTMLIWLGKQVLGQRDRHDIEHSGGVAVEWRVGDQVVRINETTDTTG